MEDRKLLVDAKALAEMLSLPVSWVYTKAEKGEIPSVKAGKYRRFNLVEVLAVLREAHQETKAQQR